MRKDRPIRPIHHALPTRRSQLVVLILLLLSMMLVAVLEPIQTNVALKDARQLIVNPRTILVHVSILRWPLLRGRHGQAGIRTLRHGARVHASPGQANHAQRSRRVRIVVRVEAEARRHVLERLDCAPEALRHPALGGEVAHQVEPHVELFAADGAEADGRVDRGQEDDGYGGGEELVIEALRSSVQVGRVVEVGEVADGVLGEIDHLLRVVGVLHYARCAVQYGSIQPDSYLALLARV